jgi:biopolymer transport protein ExbB/TolQ
MQFNSRKLMPILFCIALQWGMLPIGHLFSQEPVHQVLISDVRRIVHKKFFLVPDKVDYTVTWSVQTQQNGSWTVADPSQFSFQVACKPEGGYPLMSGNIRGTVYTFLKLKAGVRYAFAVEAYQNGIRIAVSDSAADLAGKAAADDASAGRNDAAQGSGQKVYWFEKYLPISGRLAYLWRTSIYDESSPVGRICFWLLWDCWLIGLYLIFFRCMPQLSLHKIFPMKKLTMGFYFGDKKKTYEERISSEYTSILERWKQIIDAANWSIREFIGKRKGQFESSTVDVSGASVKYWSERGSTEVRKLIDEIAHKRLDVYPTVRVFKAGLENHETGGFRWMDAAKEVETAIENQASSELEVLKRDSIFEFLWNLGTITPLLGLLGTVTGISKSFDDLSNLPDNASQKELIHQLAGGIHEALWTTIEGLIFGITFMLVYYYYQKKLEWVYSKWEEDYVYVIERL